MDGCARVVLVGGVSVAAAMMAVRSVVSSALVTTPVDCAVEMPADMVPIALAVPVLKVATPDANWVTEVESVPTPLAAAVAILVVVVSAAVNEPAAVFPWAVRELSSVLSSVAMCVMVVVLRLASSACSLDSWLDASVAIADATDVESRAMVAVCVLTAGTRGATVAAIVAGWIGHTAPKLRVYDAAVPERV